MPLPTRNDGETRKAFVSRFMKDAEATKTFPDQKQRVVVAYKTYGGDGKLNASWENANGDGPPAPADAPPSTNQNNDFAGNCPECGSFNTVHASGKDGMNAQCSDCKAEFNDSEFQGASLSATATHKQIALRIAIVTHGDKVEVDEANGIIRNVAVMTAGNADGHGFEIDATTLEQVSSLINRTPEGARSRLTHPESDASGKPLDGLPALVGRLRNARIVNNVVRGDLHLGEYAAELPGKGNVRKFLLTLAKTDPTAFGLSAVIDYDLEPKTDSAGKVVSLVARVFDVLAVDCVERPAANPTGLLSVKTNTAASVSLMANNPKGNTMNPELKAHLVSLGLPADASDEATQKYIDEMDPEALKTLRAKFSKIDIKSKRDQMTTTPNPGTAALAAVGGGTATAQTIQQAAMVDPGDEYLALAAKKSRQITELSQVVLGTSGLPAADIKAIANLAIAEGDDLPKAQTRFLKALAAFAQPLQSVRVGEHRGIASLRDSMAQAICLKAGIPRATMEKHGEKIAERTDEFAAMPGEHIFRTYLDAMGCADAFRLGRNRLADLMGTRGLRRAYPRVAELAESTSDFANITLDAINKSLRFFYLDAPRTWTIWAERKTTADFKTINRVVLSEAPNMISRDEAGELKYVNLTDSKETYTPTEYIMGIKLTRRAIINDDLDAFAVIPRQQASACARLEDTVAYAVLTGNAAMADSIAIFHASHSNYTASGTAITIASLQVGATMIEVQKGLAGKAYLELKPKFLLVPTSIRYQTEALIKSDKVIPTQSSTAAAATQQAQVNPFYNQLVVVPSVRLNEASATGWYLLSDYRDGQVNTIEMSFLADEPEPVARQETDFDTEDVKYAIRHTLGAKAIDYRGLYYNVGA